MISNFTTKDKTFFLNVDKFVCNRFGLAEVFAALFENIYHEVPAEILDVGCGVGPLSIFLADKYNCRVTATDINPIACNLCVSNVEKYMLESKISVVQGDFRYFSNLPDRKKYDLIVSVPPVDDNVSDNNISLYTEKDFSILDDNSFSFLTNSWRDENGKDLSDYIFCFANHNLSENGSVFIIFCDIDCKSTEYIVKKATFCGFQVVNSFTDYILPEKLGVEDFVKENICVHILMFQKEKADGYQG